METCCFHSLFYLTDGSDTLLSLPDGIRMIHIACCVV